MPHLDQREECAFGGRFGLAESIPPRIFPGAPRCETAKTPGRSSARTQSANEYHHKQDLCIFTGVRPLDQKTAHRRCQLGGGRGRNKGDTNADAKALFSAVCTVCTQDSKKSTGIVLVILLKPGGSGRQV